MAIIISVLSTLSVINAFEDAQMPTKSARTQVIQPEPPKGSVSLSIVEPDENVIAPGTISLTILER